MTQNNDALMSFTIRYLSTTQASERKNKTKTKTGDVEKRRDKEEEEEEERERERKKKKKKKKKGCGVREQEVKSFSYNDTPNLSLWHKLCSTTHEPRPARVTFPTTTHADFRIVNTTFWTTQSELTLCTTIRGCTCTSKHRHA